MIQKSSSNIAISFIIPARNSAAYLEQCLKSILTQTIPREQFEIIVIDNNSTDSTKAIALKFADQVIASTAATIAAVKNAGAAISQANIIAFIDSDTELPNNWAEMVLPQLKNANIAAVGSHHSLATRPDYIGKIITILNGINPPSQSETDWFLRAFALNRKLFSKLNGFDPKLITCEDVDLGYRLKLCGKLLVLNCLNPKHLDDPISLSNLFWKEYWRGQDSFIILFKHRFLLKELIYLLIQVWFWICLISMFSLLLLLNIPLAMTVLGLLLLPPVLMTIKVALRNKQLKGSPALLVYFIVFYTARALVALRGLYRLINYYCSSK